MSINTTFDMRVLPWAYTPYATSYYHAGITYNYYMDFSASRVSHDGGGYVPGWGNIYMILRQSGVTNPYSSILAQNLYTHWTRVYFYSAITPTVKLWQPLSYVRMTIPDIIYNYAKYIALIPVATIDLASFTEVDTFCLGNNFYFSPVFYNNNSLKIIQEMCEQCTMIFLYTNGSGKLACGYFVHPPTAPDWILNENEFSVKSYGEMSSRLTPKTVTSGWWSYNIQPTLPRFGAFHTTVPLVDGELMHEEYEAKWIEATGAFTYGSYIDFGDYLKLEIELGLKAFKMDLDEVVQIKHEPFGLSIDDDYPDYFRIHKIVYHLSSMTATVTLVKSKIWNISTD